MEQACRNTHIALIQCGIGTVADKFVQAVRIGSSEADCLALKLKILSKYRKILYCYKGFDCTLTFAYSFDVSGMSSTELSTALTALDALLIYDYALSADASTLYVWSCNVLANFSDVDNVITGSTSAKDIWILALDPFGLPYTGYMIITFNDGITTPITFSCTNLNDTQLAAKIETELEGGSAYTITVVGTTLTVHAPPGTGSSYNGKTVIITAVPGKFVKYIAVLAGGIGPGSYTVASTNLISTPNIIADFWNCITSEELCCIINHAYSLIDSVN